MKVNYKNPEDYMLVPGLAVPLLVAAFLVILGCCLALVSLALSPVAILSSDPINAEDQPGYVYYVPGSDHGGSSWIKARNMVIGASNAAIGLNSGMLNQWGKRIYQTRERVPTSESGNDGQFFINVKTPNFRIANDRLQIAIPFTMCVFGKIYSMHYITKGKFGDVNGDIVFKPESSSVGSARIPGLLGLGNLLGRFLGRDLLRSTEMRVVADAWDSVKDIKIAGNKLVVVI